MRRLHNSEAASIAFMPQHTAMGTQGKMFFVLKMNIYQ